MKLGKDPRQNSTEKDAGTAVRLQQKAIGKICTDLTHTSKPIALIFEMSFERVGPAQGLQFIISANAVRWTFKWKNYKVNDSLGVWLRFRV
jgi:hypothetical protein